MMVGYARTSTMDQLAGYEAQKRELEVVGCERIWGEQVSSVADRRELQNVLEFVRAGDVLVVTKLDRLARSMRHLLEVVELLERKQVSLRILGMQLDTSTPTGKLMLQVLGAVAEWERTTMLERQREGIAKAKAEGKYRGRQPTARKRYDEVRALAAAGWGPSDISEKLKIGRTSVYRALREASSSAGQGTESGHQ